jgi:hypothetical protein
MESEERTQLAWEPLTPPGVAAFASASLRRLWLVQFLVAILAAVCVVWCLDADWFPVIRAAIRRLPTEGVIRSGRLTWSGESSARLAENQFLSLAVDLRHEGTMRSTAHVQVELGERDVLLISLLGKVPIKYPRAYVIACNRGELDPWWGAWAPFILAIAAGAVILGLMLIWAFLALVYAPVAWLVAFFANRELTFRGSYLLCGAALMPGALWMIASMALYGLGVMDLLKLLIATAAHFVIGWAYVVGTPFWRPRVLDPSTKPGNPFKDQRP